MTPEALAGVLVIGEALMDVLVLPDGSEVARPGGSPANVALGLGRLGRRPQLATHIGGDSLGKETHARLAESGVRLTEGSVQAGTTSSATARLDRAGSATYEFDIRWAPARSAILPTLVGMPSHLHTGSIATALAPGADLVLAAVREAHGSATISYDPNLRPALLRGPVAERPRIEQLVSLSDVVKASEEDLAWLYPARAPTDVAREWATAGPALVVLTLGAEGAHAHWRGGDLVVPGRQVEVVDTVGAGDAFMAGLLSGLMSRGLLAEGHGPAAGKQARQRLHRAIAAPDPTPDLAPALDLAARVAAFTCTREGADPPTLVELGV
ncbi:carbohydrate kinase [Streptomyces sp. MBT27]|uniref:carbohydrate kinase family protein n=1 Tax=Streptomyces sp. MBT27 TaxID=1488356 RepID=UPI001F07E696|nr:carbohydrate kinase [Streptomyces sp. MBT27]